MKVHGIDVMDPSSEVLGEGRTLKLAGGKFEDDFAGYGVHPYRIK